MDKKTIGLVLILMIASGIIGFIFGAQNSESLPIILSNNTTDDSDNSNLTTKKTTTNKTNSTTKRNKTNSTNNITTNITELDPDQILLKVYI